LGASHINAVCVACTLCGRTNDVFRPHHRPDRSSKGRVAGLIIQHVEVVAVLLRCGHLA
jgi:hypothetical protein